MTTAAAGALVTPELAAANDDKTTGDQPLERADFAATVEPQGTATVSDAHETTDTSSLLPEDSGVAPVAETTSHQSDDGSSSGGDATVSADSAGSDVADLGTGSDPVADFSSGSASAFDFASGDGSAAFVIAEPANDSATVSVAALNDNGGTLTTQDLPVVQEVVADIQDSATVDAIIDHFAGAGDVSFGGAAMPVDILSQGLPGTAFAAGVTIDPMEDASQAAAVAQA